MRTTVRLPDELYDDVRGLAISEGVTVTSVIEDALRAAVNRHRQVAGDTFRVEPYRPTLSGTRDGVDLDDSSSLHDLMDDLG